MDELINFLCDYLNIQVPEIIYLPEYMCSGKCKITYIKKWNKLLLTPGFEYNEQTVYEFSRLFYLISEKKATYITENDAACFARKMVYLLFFSL